MSDSLSNLKYWYLEKFDFTQKLCKEERVHMEKSMVMKRVDKNTMLHFPEMKERFIYFLKEGMVKIVHYNEDGRETIKFLLSPGNIFGELALLENDEDPNDYAIAVNDCVICFMDVDNMNKMMQENNALNVSIRKLIGLRIKKLENRLASLIFKDAHTRILDFLHELFKEYGKKEGQVIKVRNFLTHDDIAKLTASSRQTVTSVLNNLRKKGIISYSSRYIELRASDILIE